METVLTESIAEAADFIKRGGIVAFPTETVYGLGANVFDEAAIAKIFDAKRRPNDNPLIAHIGEIGQINQVISEITPNAKKFIEITNPSLVIFVKYEFWFNYIVELNSERIPLISISAIFRNEHYFFKWYGAWFLKQIATIQMFFVQDETSKQLLLSSKIKEVTVSGDTRFDRVYEISKSVFVDDIVANFSKNSFVIIAGSSWPEDELILRRFYEENQSQNIKMIIAPHHVDSENISRICNEWKAFNPVVYSQINASKLSETNVMVIDCMGKLMQLYKYAKIAFVGGGFGKGIHNVLEPATFGLPLAFGPNFNKFKEANDLISLDVATVINSSSDFKQFAELQNNNELYITKSKTATKYVTENIGATDVIVDYIAKLL